jgi:hypothetical protein
MQRYLDKCTYPSENLPDNDADDDEDAWSSGVLVAFYHMIVEIKTIK